MAGFTRFFKLLTGAGQGSSQGRMAGQGLGKGLAASAARGPGGGKSGMGGGKGRGQGGGQGRCGCGQGGGQGERGERLAKITAAAKRGAGQRAPLPTVEEQPAPETLSRAAAQPESAVRAIEARAVAMTAYACRMCGRRISAAADDPIADPRCPQCGGPMVPATDA